MTNEELILKAEDLYNSGEYNQTIYFIKSLPEEEKTYPILFILAQAYSDNLEGNDIENKRIAIDILESISDAGEYDVKWLFLMGKNCFEINKEEYAIEYFYRINGIYQKDESILDLMNVEYYINCCNEVLYKRALDIVITKLKALFNDYINILNTDDNNLEFSLLKYNMNIKMKIQAMHGSGASLLFYVTSDNKADKEYIINGDSNTFENGIAYGLREFMNIIDKEIIRTNT